jgi:transposase-like protein
MAAKPTTPEPEPIERWTAQRKAAIIVEVMKGQISVPEAARKYGFTQNEYRRWADEYHRAGVEALKVNAKIRTRSTRPRSSGCARRSVSS